MSGDDVEEVSEVHHLFENEHVDLWNETDENVDGCLEDKDETEAVIHDLINNNADGNGLVNLEIVSKEFENEEEHVPTVNEIKEDLEVRLFGGILPKIKITRKPIRTGRSERDSGRGGRNEKAQDVEQHDWLAMGAVDFMLDRKKTKVRDEEEVIKLPLKVGSLYRKRKRRKKTVPIEINFDDLSDEEDKDYVANIRKSSLSNLRNTRRISKRLQKSQWRCSGGEYSKCESHPNRNDAVFQSSEMEHCDGRHVVVTNEGSLRSYDMSEIGRQEDERFNENIQIVNNNYLRSLKDSSKCREFEKADCMKRGREIATPAPTHKLRMGAKRTLGEKYNDNEVDSEGRRKGSFQEDAEMIKKVKKDEVDLDLMDELLRCIE